MTDEELIERMAGAMCRSLMIEFDGCRADQATWDRTCQSDRDKLLELAGLSLAAIRESHAVVPREPTDRALEPIEDVIEYDIPTSDMEQDCRSVYRAVIQAAESESG